MPELYPLEKVYRHPSADAPNIVEHFNAPERTCVDCAHHEGSHCYGFSMLGCMWCSCRKFVSEAMVRNQDE